MPLFRKPKKFNLVPLPGRTPIDAHGPRNYVDQGVEVQVSAAMGKVFTIPACPPPEVARKELGPYNLDSEGWEPPDSFLARLGRFVRGG